MKKIYLLLGSFCLLLPMNLLLAQAPQKPTSADIHDDIKKLNVLASALYVAAHPDDENTRLIAYLSNHLRANTAYLSLTRGDGGQNLIGPEIRELLGVIRTQELLMARSVDGGQQMFTRANDFGYSKNPEETLRIWNKEEVLADVIWAIRKFQPDIIVNRFSHDSGRRTHGHHTSSAMLSYEAFDMVGDKNVYPEQLKYVSAWQPKRLFFNTSWWFYGSREKFADADKSRMLSVDVGVYYPLKGKSNTEIAAESRSMHKCQGFGSTGTRGSMNEYMQLLKGDMPKDKTDPFEGINTTWTRLDGGAPIGKLLAKVEKEFKHEDPSASVPDLVRAYKMIQALPDGYWKAVKTKEIKAVIQACLAMYVEAVSADYSATPGQSLELSLETINRSPIEVVLQKITYQPLGIDSTLNQSLTNNQSYKFYKTVQLPEDLPTTTPYWLNKRGSLGMYAVEDQLMRGLPETPRSLNVRFDLTINGVPIDMTVPVVYKKNDPVKGETYRPFEVSAPVFANIEDKVYVFADEEPQTIKVLVKSGRPDVKGRLKLAYPDGWRLEPEFVDFELKLKGEEKTVNFTLYPSAQQDENKITAMVEVGNEVYMDGLVSIEYDHIPTQTVLQEATSKVVRIDLKRAGQNIGYIMGAGDEIPGNLEQIGYTVTILEDRDITPENLRRFDAIIMGIRAYNTVDRLKFHQGKLMEYVENGGTMIVQYNTAHRLVMKDLAPYPIKLSRDRVAVEEAEIRFLQPDHEVLNYPNKITQKDFDGWVQERGLYFPNEWDDNFQAILSSNDPGETPKDGGLLVAKYGKGHYVYTGYSWFRELPAGVPGAYRLFTNLISVGKRP